MGHHLFDSPDGGLAGNLVTAGQPAPVILRDYQVKARAAVLAARDRGLHRVMVVMPTGCGKTTVFANLVDAFHRDYNVPSLVVAHRQELLQQAAHRIGMMSPNLTVGVEGGDHKAPFEARCVVAGVQTIGRPDTDRLRWFQPGFMILDEGHHAAADTWQNVMRRFGSYSGECFTLAVTATDHRMDNRPLHGTEEAIFEDVVFRYSLKQAVMDGWLVDLRGYRVATGIDLSNVRTHLGDYSVSQLANAVNVEARNVKAFEHWSEIARDRPTIVFCVNVEHAKNVAELFQSHGVAAESVDGTMRSDLREGVMRRFARGKTQVLVNVEVATEGYDAPIASCILMLRPTQSWALYTQMAGRGIRTLPGVVDGILDPAARRRAIRDSAKPDCLVIDVVDVTKELNLNAPPDPDEEDERPPARASATVAGLIGLPDNFDLQGHSLFEAAEWLDELPAPKRVELFRRQMSFDDLSTALTEVDLLRELSVPEELQEITRLAWMKIGEARYYLPCGGDGIETDRTAEMYSDELGRYHLHLRSSLMDYGGMALGTDLQTAFDEADRLIHMTFRDCAPIVRVNARWREEAPTDRQMHALRRLGVEDTALAAVKNRGQARALIEQLKIGMKRPGRRPR